MRTPRRTKRSAKRTLPLPASPCTPTDDLPDWNLTGAATRWLQAKPLRLGCGPPAPREARPSSAEPASSDPKAVTEHQHDEGVLTAMSTSVTLPALGESVTEGTVSRWLKQIGDNVEADEPLLEISTDKVDTEIPSPASGVLLEIKAQEDETVEVGAVLAVIGEASEAGGDGEAPPEPEQQTAAAAQASSETDLRDEGAPSTSSDADEPRAAEAAAVARPAAAAPSGDGAAGGTDVTLPALGESVTEGTVSRWLKQVGDEVQADEPLLEVSTDKVDTEIPSPASGTLREIKVGEDETVDVGAELAVIGPADGAAAAGPTERPAQPSQAAPSPATTPDAAAAKAETPLEAEAGVQAAADAQSEQRSEPEATPAPAAQPAPAAAAPSTAAP